MRLLYEDEELTIDLKSGVDVPEVSPSADKDLVPFVLSGKGHFSRTALADIKTGFRTLFSSDVAGDENPHLDDFPPFSNPLTWEQVCKLVINSATLVATSTDISTLIAELNEILLERDASEDRSNKRQTLPEA